MLIPRINERRPSLSLVEAFDDEHHRMDGAESPNVELFDRTGELLDNDMGQWQSSAVYDHRTISNGGDDERPETHVWSVIDDLTRKTQEVLVNEPKVSSLND